MSVALTDPVAMPFYMDRHDLAGATASYVANAHLRDLDFEDDFGVQVITYWFDDLRHTAFCLARSPDPQALEALHRASHGLVPNEIIEVDKAIVEQFMGGVAMHQPGEPYVETAMRAVLFTDLEGSTKLTQQLGDARAMEILRRHDAVVRQTLVTTSGSEVKHTGDGVMASYESVVGAIRGAVLIHQGLSAPEADERLPVGVRIGISAGEPVTERSDLFGATVQLAARLCARAAPGSILVSSAVRDLAVGKGFEFRKAGTLQLKGFDERVRTFEVLWRTAGAS